MYDGNPGEIDFGSSEREVPVSEGSSYRESTVVFMQIKVIYFIKIVKLISRDAFVQIPLLSSYNSQECHEITEMYMQYYNGQK